MTDNQYVTTLKEEAVELLMTESFSHVRQLMHEAYVGLAKQNCILQKCNHRFFYFDGVYYPPDLQESTRHAPFLHVSLLDQLQTINNYLADRDYRYVRNYFSAVMSNSFNKIVLDEMIPTTLLNMLKTEYTSTQFDVIDRGYLGSSYREPIVTTRENLANLKHHYSETLKRLQNTLMEKLLLQ